MKGKVAIVTGAARGIGEAIAVRLASEGCSVVVSDINLQGCNQVVERITQAGASAHAVQADMAIPSDAENLVKETLAQYARADILVNNAGITRDNLILRMKEADWDTVLDVNLKGTYNGIKAIARHFIKQRSGKIINIASVVGLIGNAGQANYAASKAGVIGLTKSAAREFGSRSIQVNAVAPGFIETEMTRDLPAGAVNAFLDSIPLGRSGTVSDVADAVYFLASPLSDYITGQVIQVDGGMVM